MTNQNDNQNTIPLVSQNKTFLAPELLTSDFLSNLEVSIVTMQTTIAGNEVRIKQMQQEVVDLEAQTSTLADKIVGLTGQNDVVPFRRKRAE